MRVMMLSWDHPHQATGGIAAHVTGLGNALVAAGHDVVLLTTARPDADVTAERQAGVRVFRADADLPWIPDTRRIARIASANHAVAKLADDVERALPGWRPDVVHGHDWTTGWAADLLATRYGVAFVLTMHGTETIRHSANLPQGEPTDIAAIEWWLAFQADRLISPTRFVVEHLIEDFELSPDQIDRIPNGIDRHAWTTDGEPSTARSAADSATHSTTNSIGETTGGAAEPGAHVVSWGRVQYEKGFQVLARAMASVRTRVPEVRGTIAGRGSYLPELQTQMDIDGVSDIVELTGYLRDDELRRLVASAGCVVIPSLYEPFGIVALEALAAGAPLIVARTGGLAELVGGTRAALTFEPGNPDDLAHCIQLVLTDPELRAELTANARRLVERDYAWGSIAATTTETYERAIRERHRRLG